MSYDTSEERAHFALVQLHLHSNMSLYCPLYPRDVVRLDRIMSIMYDYVHYMHAML